MRVYVVYCRSDRKPMKFLGGLRVFEDKEDAQNYCNLMYGIDGANLYVKEWIIRLPTSRSKGKKGGKP